jgi:hypothetical protein
MSFPTRLPYAARLCRARTTAIRRYYRRNAAVDWFWTWADAKWRKQPHLSTKVHATTVRDVPALHRFRPRKSALGWHDNICYEDVLQLEDQASMLVTQLESVCVKTVQSSTQKGTRL